MNGERHYHSLHDFTRDEINKWILYLRNRVGIPNTRLRKLQYTTIPSIQGVWNPFTNRDPKLNITSFPSVLRSIIIRASNFVEMYDNVHTSYRRNYPSRLICLQPLLSVYKRCTKNKKEKQSKTENGANTWKLKCSDEVRQKRIDSSIIHLLCVSCDWVTFLISSHLFVRLFQNVEYFCHLCQIDNEVNKNLRCIYYPCLKYVRNNRILITSCISFYLFLWRVDRLSSWSVKEILFYAMDNIQTFFRTK